MQITSALVLAILALGIVGAPLAPGNAKSGGDASTGLSARGHADTNSPAQDLQHTRERSLAASYDVDSDLQWRSLEYRSSDFDCPDEAWILARVVPPQDGDSPAPATPAGAGKASGAVGRARVGPFGKAEAGRARKGKAMRKLAKSLFNQVTNRGRSLDARAVGDEEFELARSLEGLKGEVIVLCSLELN